MCNLSLSVHKTIYKRDKNYANYVDHNIDGINQNGLLYSEIYDISHSSNFETFYKSNYIKRQKMILKEDVGLKESLVLLYNKMLL